MELLVRSLAAAMLTIQEFQLITQRVYIYIQC